MFKNYVFVLIVVVVVVLVGLAVYHLVSYDPIEHLGEGEIHGLIFKEKAPTTVTVLESFTPNSPTYHIEDRLQHLADSKDNFLSLTVSASRSSVYALAITDDGRSYFANETILPLVDRYKYLAKVSRAEAKNEGGNYLEITIYYAKNWLVTTACLVACVLLGMAVLEVSCWVLRLKIGE